VGLVGVNKGNRLRAALTPTPLQHPCQVGPSPAPSLPLHLRRAIGLSLSGDGAVDPWPRRGFQQGGSKPQKH